MYFISNISGIFHSFCVEKKFVEFPLCFFCCVSMLYVEEKFGKLERELVHGRRKERAI